MENVFEVLRANALEYSEQIKIGGDIPAPPIDLQLAIKDIKITDFPRGKKSNMTYAELNQIRSNVEEVQERLGYEDELTVIALVVAYCNNHLTGKFKQKIDMIQNIMAKKPDREEMIWKSNVII